MPKKRRLLENAGHTADTQGPKASRRSAAGVSSPAPDLLSAEEYAQLLERLREDVSDETTRWDGLESVKKKTSHTLIRIAKCNLTNEQWAGLSAAMRSEFPRLLEAEGRDYPDLLMEVNVEEERRLLGMLFGESYRALILAVVKALKWSKGHAVPVLAAILSVWWGRLGDHRVTVREVLTYFHRKDMKSGFGITQHFWEVNGAKPWPTGIPGRKREVTANPGAGIAEAIAAPDGFATPGKGHKPCGPGPLGARRDPATPFSSVVKKLGSAKLESPGPGEPCCAANKAAPVDGAAQWPETGGGKLDACAVKGEDADPEQKTEAAGWVAWGGTPSSPPHDWAMPGSQEPGDLLQGLSQPIEANPFLPEEGLGCHQDGGPDPKEEVADHVCPTSTFVSAVLLEPLDPRLFLEPCDPLARQPCSFEACAVPVRERCLYEDLLPLERAFLPDPPLNAHGLCPCLPGEALSNNKLLSMMTFDLLSHELGLADPPWQEPGDDCSELEHQAYNGVPLIDDLPRFPWSP